MMTSIPLSSVPTSRAGVLAGRLGLIVLLALAIPTRMLNLDAFAGKFDEGIRGTQLMLMAAGYRPFRDIFASQGPLSLDIFFPTYLLFGQTLYPTWLFNTLWVGAVVVILTLLLAVPAGYSLARLTGRWGERLGIGIFLTYLVPSTLLFIPFSRLVSALGLQNSLWALVLIYPTFTVPFGTWLLMGFFKSLPKEVEESAMVDGCSRVGAIWRMVLPLSVPGLLTVVIFALTLVIQEFVYSLTFISSVQRMTVSVGVPVALVRGDVYYWGSLMAACLITSVPIAILYNLFLDRFLAGFTVGAVK